MNYKTVFVRIPSDSDTIDKRMKDELKKLDDDGFAVVSICGPIQEKTAGHTGLLIVAGERGT